MAELYPDISVPTLLSLPPFPGGDSQLPDYLRKLHFVLNDNQQKLVRALYILGKYRIVVGDTDTLGQLTPHGSGTVFINTDDNQASYDHPDSKTWVPLLGGGGLGLSFSLGAFAGPPIFTGPREPIVAFEQQPQVELGDDVVTRCSGLSGGTHVDQPSDFLWTVEGDIVMGLV